MIRVCIVCEGQTEVDFVDNCLRQTEHGPLIAERIGIEAIRRKCPAFNEWVAHLQAWGAAA